MTQDTCQVCQQTLRTDRSCDAGWIEVEQYPPEQGRAPLVARCRQWEAHLAATAHASGLEASGLTDAAYTASWNDLDLTSRAWQAAHSIARHVEDVIERGLNVVLSGVTGTGKTHAGVLITRAAMGGGATAMKLDWSRFLDGVRDSFNDRTLESEGQQLQRLVAVDFLMLDDIGSGDAENNRFSLTRLEKVIGRRYDAGKPTLLTVNFKPQLLAEVIGDRAAGRIKGRVMEISFTTKYREHTERQEVADLVSRLWAGATR
ncbi:ATP-binding protein [Deinococcus peraridilitoris]|uniref:DNA replication protein n=1 Tax=Deinococcus peraridilitoris (strain DSM 19664 / LMG 22246 / CIP 109416 / KR-200) TaxID=937777 RepID=L0A0X3_DEIPD|nr:ATP-binding protein [Deinococcus peraridilitoris]AFZ67548.1 DNA replication protein [Deinococcus peraridilitoris DSM 19664]